MLFEKIYIGHFMFCFDICTFLGTYQHACCLLLICTISMLDYACVDSARQSVVYDTQSTYAIFVTGTLNAGMNTVLFGNDFNCSNNNHAKHVQLWACCI